MTLISETDLAKRFLVAQNDLFEVLDSPENGVALIETPGLDTQALVEEYEQLLVERQIVPLPGDTAMYSGNRHLGVRRGASRLAPEVFQSTFINTASTLGSVISTALLTGTSKKRTFSSDAMIRARQSNALERHADTNVATVYWGASKPGHIMYTPSGEAIALAGLPNGHALVTRQRSWAYYHPDFNLSDGIEHEVSWQGDQDNIRAVGIQFIN